MLSLLAALQFSRFEGHLRGAHRGGGAVGGGQLPVRPCPAWAGPCLVESFEELPPAWIDRTGVIRIARVESLDKRRAHTFQAFGQLTFETHLSTPGRSGLGKSGPESASRHQPLSTSASVRSEQHTSELQSLMRISYAVFCLQKKKRHTHTQTTAQNH